MSEEKQSDALRLIGSWRHIGSTVNGQPRPGQGAHPKGIIMYDAMATWRAKSRRTAS